LFLNPGGFLGGAERSLLDILAILRTHRPAWELSVIAGGDGPLIEKAIELDAQASVLAMPARMASVGDSRPANSAARTAAMVSLAGEMAAAAPSALAYSCALRRAIRSIAPSVIHTNGFKMHLAGAMAAPKRTPILWHVHDYVGRRPAAARMMRIAARRCSAAIANSDSVRSDFIEAIGAHPACTTVYNAVNPAVFKPNGSVLDLDAAAHLPHAPEGTVRVGMVATLARWKGHDVFIRALGAIASRVPVRGYLIGGPLYATRSSQYSMAELRSLVGALGMSGRIGFTDHLEDVASALRALDIAVHASTEPEPFGLSIAEAMACGRAVIAADAGGAAEIAKAGAGVVLHRPGDIEGLAREIERLSGSLELRRSLGAAGYQAANRLFAPNRIASKLIPIYERLESPSA
jgi:glycosyltransferase involved in cell wall biosynthesis